MAIPNTSFSGGSMSDYLQALRQAIQNHTPNPFSALGLTALNPTLAMPLAAAQGDVLNNHKVHMIPSGASAAPSAPAATTPSGVPQMPWWASGDMAKMIPQAAPQPAATAHAAAPAPAAPAPTAQATPVPMPQPRPADAPQASPSGMSWFQQNAAMMRDPSTGQFIDPAAAAQAQVSGPDLINKMLNYLHGKQSNS